MFSSDKQNTDYENFFFSLSRNVFCKIFRNLRPLLKISINKTHVNTVRELIIFKTTKDDVKKKIKSKKYHQTDWNFFCLNPIDISSDGTQFWNNFLLNCSYDKHILIIFVFYQRNKHQYRDQDQLMLSSQPFNLKSINWFAFCFVTRFKQNFNEIPHRCGMENILIPRTEINEETLGLEHVNEK